MLGNLGPFKLNVVYRTVSQQRQGMRGQQKKVKNSPMEDQTDATTADMIGGGSNQNAQYYCRQMCPYFEVLCFKMVLAILQICCHLVAISSQSWESIENLFMLYLYLLY